MESLHSKPSLQQSAFQLTTTHVELNVNVRTAHKQKEG